MQPFNHSIIFIFELFYYFKIIVHNSPDSYHGNLSTSNGTEFLLFLLVIFLMEFGMIIKNMEVTSTKSNYYNLSLCENHLNDVM